MSDFVDPLILPLTQDGAIANAFAKLGGDIDVESHTCLNIAKRYTHRQLGELAIDDDICHLVATFYAQELEAAGFNLSYTTISPEDQQAIDEALDKPGILSVLRTAHTQATIYGKGYGEWWVKPSRGKAGSIRDVDIDAIVFDVPYQDQDFYGRVEPCIEFGIIPEPPTREQLYQNDLAYPRSTLQRFIRAYARYDLSLSLLNNLLHRVVMLIVKEPGGEDSLLLQGAEAEKDILKKLEAIQKMCAMGVGYFGENTSVEVVSRNIPKIEDQIKVLRDRVVAASGGVSEVSLFGISGQSGGLGQKDDRDRVQTARRTAQLFSIWRPWIKKYCDGVVWGLLNKGLISEFPKYDVVQPNPMVLTPLEEIELRKGQAEIDKIYKEIEAIRNDEIRGSRFGKAFSIETNLTELETAAAEDKGMIFSCLGETFQIQYPVGSDRHGSGIPSTCHYGCVRGIDGIDGKRLDFYAHPRLMDGAGEYPAFMIRQLTLEGAIDEHKLMVGFLNEAEARAHYLMGLDDVRRFGGILRLGDGDAIEDLPPDSDWDKFAAKFEAIDWDDSGWVEELEPEELDDSLDSEDAALKDLPRENSTVRYRGRLWTINRPVKSDRPGKKKMVLASKKGVVKLVHYGAIGYKHNYSPAARKNYLARAGGIRNKNGEQTSKDPHSPNYWAMRDLWGYRG